MRRFLVCSGVHGRIESLEWLHRAVRQRSPDGVLFAGGVLARERTYAPTATTCWGHTRGDTLFLQRFFDSLGGLGVFTAIIPGVLDAPLDLFLSLGVSAENEHPHLHVVHATPVEQGDVAVVGLGARITDYTSTDIGYYSRSLAEYYLRTLRTTSKRRTVLLLPEGPRSWLGESEDRRMASDLMAAYRPAVAVLGRPSEKRGVSRLADTLVINPGHLSDGSAAWLDWDRPAPEQVEFLDLRSTGKPRQPPALGRGEEPRRVAGQAAVV